jgi:hypothetical protein
MKDFIRKHWPLVIHIATGLVLFLDPAVKAYAASNPSKSTLLLLAWAQFMHLVQSPIGTQGSKF